MSTYLFGGGAIPEQCIKHVEAAMGKTNQSVHGVFDLHGICRFYSQDLLTFPSFRDVFPLHDKWYRCMATTWVMCLLVLQ